MKCSLKSAVGVAAFVLAVSVIAQGQAASPGNSGAGSSAAASLAGKAHDNAYIIGNDDELAINVWKEAELSKTIPVRSDGKISLPLVGEIEAAGKTPMQLEDVISEKLKAYMTDPEVTVIVEKINSKKYNIMGEVSKPGLYPLTLTTTVMDAIAAAGGFREFAKKKGIYILRQNPDGTQARLNFNYKDFIKGKHLEENVKIESGDTIIVP